MRIALAQLNPIVGDVAGNTNLVLDAIERARRQHADVLLTSELVLVGYPPRDLLLREGVVEACEQAVRAIAQKAGDMYVIVGHPRMNPGGTRPFHNSASICHRGRILVVADKQLLPGYDVFDEDRYFEPGQRTCIVEIAGRRIAALICEDLWQARDVNGGRRYAIEPAAELAARGCDLVLTLNASPFVVSKWQRHVEQMSELARTLRAPVIAVNQVGANDDLIFDGRSLAVNADGRVIHTLQAFEPEVHLVDALQLQSAAANDTHALTAMDKWRESSRELFHALTLGLRDYCRKTGNQQVFIGLSGGIDSALTAVLATAALGPRNVIGVMMPSRYSSPGSISDALELARRLGLASPRELPITSVHDAMREAVKPALGTDCRGVTDENIQARIRGMMLMAMANALGGLVLVTSNKSEIAMGYSTLYGDMCGAIAPLGDLTKTRLYRLANWINANHVELGFTTPPIPENSISKPPSAELRPHQTDQDTLPPYDLLDEIVQRYIEREQSAETIIQETGIDAALVRKTVVSIDRAQYKRDQAPVILKTTYRAFGRGRPMPIVMKQSAFSDLPSAVGDRLAASDPGGGAPSKAASACGSAPIAASAGASHHPPSIKDQSSTAPR